jgi:MFS family permease
MLNKNRRFALIILFFLQLFLLIDLRNTFFPIYLTHQGVSNTQTGIILSIGGLGVILIRPLTSLLIRGLGYLKTMLGAIALGCVSIISLIGSPSFSVLLVISVIWGMSIGMNQPLGLMMVAQSVPSEEQGMGASIRMMANRTAELINPLVFTIISGIFGLTLGFAVVGTSLLILSLLTGKGYRSVTRDTANH